MTTMSDVIRNSKSGKIIDYSEKSLANAVEKMLESKIIYNKYKNAAIGLSPQFDINYILKDAIEKIP
jgi:hypothetical protein